MNYKYIAVESSIGNYKNELCKKLADFFGADLIEENQKNNSFLTKLNLNDSKSNLALQLKCLLKRCDFLEELKKSKLIISDFIMENDKIIAPIILNEEELSIYWEIKQKLMPDTYIIRPNLLIYLQCSDNIANKRLYEKNIAPNWYLNKIHNRYRNFFHIYNEIPMLIVNTDELDFLHNNDHFNLLIKTIYNMHGKKYYLNLSE